MVIILQTVTQEHQISTFQGRRRYIVNARVSVTRTPTSLITEDIAVPIVTEEVYTYSLMLMRVSL